MNSDNDRKPMRVVPRWVVVFGILVIMGIVLYGLARIVLPMQRAWNQQISGRGSESPPQWGFRLGSQRSQVHEPT